MKKVTITTTTSADIMTLTHEASVPKNLALNFEGDDCTVNLQALGLVEGPAGTWTGPGSLEVYEDGALVGRDHAAPVTEVYANGVITSLNVSGAIKEGVTAVVKATGVADPPPPGSRLNGTLELSEVNLAAARGQGRREK